MKRLKYLGYLCIALTCRTAQAQSVTVTGMRWLDDGKRLQVSWTEKAGEGMKSEYSQYLTPMLCNGTDTLRFPQTVVRGRLNRKRLERAIRLNGHGNAGVTGNELKAGDTLNFLRIVDVQPWMKHGAVNFCVETESEGCCDVTTLPTRCLLQAVYIPPFNPLLTRLEEKGKAGELEKRYPIVRPIADYQPYRNARSPMYINFPLDKHEVRRDFRENAERLDLIVSMTRDIMADTISRVCRIQIVGKASPEGPLKHNIELAGNRVNALKRYLQERVDVPDSLFEVINGGEAWEEFRTQVAATDLPYRQDILDIIDGTEDVNLREREIKRYKGGEPYRYLLKNVLLDQRYSGYLQIYYDYKPDTVPPIVNRSIELIREGKNEEALALIQTVAHDRRSYNTLGTALYLNGRRKEAETYFRRAIEDGNEDARRNLQQIEAIVEQAKYMKQINKEE